MPWRRGEAYSQDLRDRVLAAEGSAREVAARFGVSPSYVVKARQRRDRFGEIAPRPQRSHTPRRLAAWREAIAAQVRAHPDATMAELREWLFETHGIRASMGLVWNTLDQLRPLVPSVDAAAIPSRDRSEGRRLAEPRLN